MFICRSQQNLCVSRLRQSGVLKNFCSRKLRPKGLLDKGLKDEGLRTEDRGHRTPGATLLWINLRSQCNLIKFPNSFAAREL